MWEDLRMREKPKVGDVLVRVVHDRYARRKGGGPEFRNVVVGKVGRKFFYTRPENHPEWPMTYQHDIEDYCNFYSDVYQDEQEYHDEQEALRIQKIIANKLQYGRFNASKETFQNVAALLGINTTKEQK